MAEWLDIGDFFREIDPELCQCAYAFCKSVFLLTLTFNCHIAISNLIWQWLVNSQLNNYNTLQG